MNVVNLSKILKRTAGHQDEQRPGTLNLLGQLIKLNNFGYETKPLILLVKAPPLYINFESAHFSQKLSWFSAGNYHNPKNYTKQILDKFYIKLN